MGKPMNCGFIHTYENEKLECQPLSSTRTIHEHRYREFWILANLSESKTGPSGREICIFSKPQDVSEAR